MDELDLKIYYKATITKTVWYQHKDGSMRQHTESKNTPTRLCLINFQQKCQGNSMRGGKVFSINGWKQVDTINTHTHKRTY